MEEYALSLHAASGGGAIVPHYVVDGVPAENYIEPIAEHNFARKKMHSLEEGIDKLRKDTRQLHETVTQQGADMKIMVSELDLRRAIGLAFQEFELRLEDAFTDSNRKCLAMFSKRDEMAEMQATIAKKVNWSEYNTVMKKMSELRQYIDTMAESVFIGHREALNSEFAKKADRHTVEQALKQKVGLEEVSDVRARLERLEVLVAHTDTRQSTALQELRNDLAEQSKTLTDKHQAFMTDVKTNLSALKAEGSAAKDRIASLEANVAALNTAVKKMSEGELSFRAQHESIMKSIASVKERMEQLAGAEDRTRQELGELQEHYKDFQNNSAHRFTDLSGQVDNCKERLDFLMQATEMLKRKSKEAGKANDKRFTEAHEEQEKMMQHLVALERQLKRQERDLRCLENRVARGDNVNSTMKALPAPAPSGLELVGGVDDPGDTPGNNRLKLVMEQLEKIAAGGHPFEHMGMDVDPKRPPLPFVGDDRLDGDSQHLSRFGGSAGPAPIDSARGPSYPYPAPSAASRLGLSPRPAVAGSVGVATVGGLAAAIGKAPRKKK